MQEAFYSVEAGKILFSVESLSRARAMRLHLELTLPVAKDVGVYSDQLSHFTDPEIELIGDVNVIGEIGSHVRHEALLLTRRLRRSEEPEKVGTSAPVSER